jgi:hypothetical protein
LIDPSGEAILADGFLNPSYSEDLAHGNINYGEIIADKIAKFVEE